MWDAIAHCGKARQAAVLLIARCCGVGSFQQRLVATYSPAATSVTVMILTSEAVYRAQQQIQVQLPIKAALAKDTLLKVASALGKTYLPLLG